MKIHQLILALTACFMIAVQSQLIIEPCVLCIYPAYSFDPFNINFGVCTYNELSRNNEFYDEQTPFVGDRVTLNAFRYVVLSNCNACELTAFSNTDYTGQSQVVQGSTFDSMLSFCAKSYTLSCRGLDIPGGEEEEEEYEEEGEVEMN